MRFVLAMMLVLPALLFAVSRADRFQELNNPRRLLERSLRRAGMMLVPADVKTSPLVAWKGEL